MDHTTLHPLCASQAHLIDLHLWRGAPKNLDETRPIQILVNHGYVAGFCPERLQPAWSAYRVAHADQDVDYDRPLNYFDDMRLDEDYRIGKRTFGRIGGVQLNVGHMTPNEVINRQFGRLAQLETFMMSNMSPQYGSLNSGVWLKLETAIREIEDEPGKDHVWAIVGPIFGEEPASVYRGRGKHLPVPESYFCILVDPHRYPYDTPSRVNIDCFIIPQDAPRSSSPEDYPATLEDVEQATNLEFFDSWGRDIPVALESGEEPRTRSRLMQVLERKRSEWAEEDVIEQARPEADTLSGLIEALQSEAGQLQKLKRPLTPGERIRVRLLQHTISWLIKARDLAKDRPEPEEPEPEEPEPENLITYKIVSDVDDKLKNGARAACNFWNGFVEPKASIVMRLGTFTQASRTIARAYKPYVNDDIRYGRVEFNTRYLSRFSDEEIAGTLIHELGHTLGIGWEDWSELFSRDTGKFTADAVGQLAELEEMEVERTGGAGTAFSHWVENRFDKELMTGYKDQGEIVMPVTIDLMEVLGHKVKEHLDETKNLSDLLEQAMSVVFSRQGEVRQLDLEHFEETEVFENIPHEQADEASDESESDS